MLLKPLREIGLRDLEELIGNVAEGLQVDFKQAAVGKADAERKEFVADVTAFANASGGDIVFGIVEGPDAVASQVLGIPVADLDAEERRLAEIIRNGTEPRLSDFEFKWIDNPPNGHVLILRIGRSWRAPHRVTLAGHDRFYIRKARGKHPMNTDELRTAFTRGQALEDRIAQFQRARIDLIAERQGPVDMGGGPKLVVHALPLVSFADPPAVQFRYGEVLQSPLGGGSYNQMHTLEGPVTYGFRGTTISRYTLHFRNGILEGVTDCASDIQTSSIPLTPVEATIARAVSDHLKYWNEKGIGPPYFLFVSILFAEGYLGISGSMWSEEGVRVKRRHLLLPSQVITQSEGIHIGTLLRPTFDLLWNGFGYSSSVNFDERGRYRVQR